LAIITMQMIPATSWITRFTGVIGGASVFAISPSFRIPTTAIKNYEL
jgi:hypothetical protein